MMYNLLLKTSSVCLLFLIIFYCTEKLPEPIVARSGNTTIPVSEFNDRFELTPHINHSTDVNRNKRNILTSLLGEKLLVEAAQANGLDKNEKFQTYSEQIKNEAIVEKLIDKEIASKIEISADEVKQGFVRSQVNLALQVLTFDSEEQAFKAKSEIDSGSSLIRVKRKYQTDTFISADSVITLQMKWGEAHPNLEEAAYSLKIGEVADPVFADGRYYILKLVNRSNVVFLTEGEFINKAPSIRKKIQQRKRAEMYAQYMQALMADKQVRVSHQVFDQVATALERIYGIEETSSISNEGNLEISTDSLQKNIDIADHLDDPFARFDDGSVWSIGDFIKKLGVGPYPLNKKTKKSFRSSLRSIVRKMTELETLAKKGIEENLQNSYYVHYQTKMWQDSYLGQLIRKQIIDTVNVSNEEIKYYYNKHKNNYTRPEMVKLHEILVDDLALAEQILQQVKKGGSFSKLARLYNKRELSIKTGGVLGYFKPTALGKIGEVAKQLKKAEIAGPVKTEKNQYSVFKLLDKIKAGPMPIEETWEDVKRDALSEKRLRAVDNMLIKLVDKYEVEIKNAVIDTLQINDINMLILKQHYAGRTAAPTITPLQNSPRWQNFMDKIYPIQR